MKTTKKAEKPWISERMTVELKPTIYNKQVGGYYLDADQQGHVIRFEIRETGNHYYNVLILIHELIEQALCRRHGITEADTDVWDATHFMDANEPADIKGSPYRAEHRYAEKIERIICNKLGIRWKDYERCLDNLCLGDVRED